MVSLQTPFFVLTQVYICLSWGTLMIDGLNCVSDGNVLVSANQACTCLGLVLEEQEGGRLTLHVSTSS